MVEQLHGECTASVPKKKGKSGLLSTLPPTIHNGGIRKKESGFILAIDQATNSAGVSLWFNGMLVDGIVLCSLGPDLPYCVRIKNQLEQLNKFLDSRLPPDCLIETVVFEGVRERLVLVVAGAFCTARRVSAQLGPKYFVETPKWKKWAKDHGASQPFKDVKGVRALLDVGFYETTTYRTDSDDIADSILIYLTWRDRK